MQAVTNLTKPLGAVSRIVEKGNRVVFDDISYIENKTSGERTYLRYEAGVFVLDAIVRRHDPRASFMGQVRHP